MPVVDMTKLAIRGGRYDRVARTPEPPGGLPRRRAGRNVSTVTAAVVDPWGNGRDRIAVTVNRRTDVLETELSHGRISEAAYQVGTRIQETVESASSLGSSFWPTDARVDSATCHETTISRRVEHAQRIRALADNVAKIVGVVDMRLLRRIIGDRMSFEACAALEGKGGERGTRYVACRFRDALEEVAKHWGAKGKPTGEVLSGTTDRPEDVAVEADRDRWEQLGAGVAGRVRKPEAHKAPEASDAVG